jgi:hypothetical protein
MRFILIMVLGCAALHAQAVGDPAPNKALISTWNAAAGVDEIHDYLPDRVVLLDWFGVS